MAQEAVTVWTRPERGTRGPAAVHSRADLTAAAIGLADRGGLPAVSMRQVAAALGTGQASLYRYLSGREDLLDLMVDSVTGEVDLDVPLRGEPVEDLLALAVRTKAVQVRHPWLGDVPPEPLRLGPRGLDHLEYALRALAPTALPGGAKTEVVALVNALVAQFARVEVQGGGEVTARRAAQAGYLREAAAKGDHPQVTAALRGAGDGAGADDGAGAEAGFERMMRKVLAGLLVP
ncbi:TetR/AcrR family transcriptional regulator [Streptomyces sp. NPDC051561]|uniref:TetR/AcrR family transcriptional regulator n=1 Tax=Streptomyces sp. NPDC051561 TaxID=3365658 RepID=UPI003791FF07